MDFHAPFDSKACDTRFFSEHVATDTLDINFGRGLGIHLFRVIFVVDVVSNANEFPIVVAARQEDHSNAQNLGIRDTLQVRRVGFEYEFVDSHRYGTDE